MENLFSRTTCWIPRLLSKHNVHRLRALSSLSGRQPPIVSETALPPEIPESSQTPANQTVAKAFSLQDRTVIVTGAARGLGSTLALAVLEAGANVACLDVLPQPYEADWHCITNLQEELGLGATYHQCDATDEGNVAKVMTEVALEAKMKKQPVRGLIHCAGIQQTIDAINYPANDFKRILDVNIIGSFVVAKHTAQLMKQANVSGSIVLIASMSGQIANRGIRCSAYNTSKGAVHQLCRSLATEWGQYGIRVNSLSPGYIRTAMTDQLLAEEPEMEKLWMAGALLGRLGAPEDFKAPAIYMLGDGAAFMTGADLRVDGGHCASA